MIVKTLSATAFGSKFANRFKEGHSGCSVPEGWAELIEELDRDLALLIPDYTIHQVKTKFHSLRFYARHEGFVSARNEVISGFKSRVEEAEKQSEVTCLVCGDDAVPDGIPNLFTVGPHCTMHAPKS